jgi:thioredoxin-dependent peroxiredoxin
MRTVAQLGLLATALAACAPAAVSTPPAVSTAPAEQNFLAVGEVAPDFALPGATRYGPLAQPVRLSDYRGETVVLAFFYRVRGGG